MSPRTAYWARMGWVFITSLCVFLEHLVFALPQEAQAVLDSLPEKKVTLALVIQKAKESSESFRAVRSQAVAIEVPELRAQAPLDYQFFLKANYSIDRREPVYSFFPNRTHLTSYSMGVSTYFPTGTSLSAELLHDFTDRSFIVQSNQSFYETKASLNLKQNLWRDALGYATQRAMQAGENLREANRFSYREAQEDWLMGIIGVYYQAWLAQAEAKAGESNWKRRKRLLQVVQIKRARGTSEEPELLQTQSVLSLAQIEKDKSGFALKEKWRELVVSLKFPEALAEIDPKEIPIVLDGPAEEEIRFCQEGEQPKESVTTRKVARQTEAARLSEESMRNLEKPSLELGLGLYTNGVDLRRSPSLTETIRAQYPAWVIGATLSVPLLGYEGKANHHLAVSDRLRLEALSSLALERLRVDWKNYCADLGRAHEARGHLEDILKDQIRRVDLEERRFEIGQTNTLSVIQAADDASQTELLLKRAEMEVRALAWRIRKLSNRLGPYLGESEN